MTSQRRHSVEAEAREILEAAVRPEGRVKLGSLLADIGRQGQLTKAVSTLPSSEPHWR
jgi:plasmid stability protein